MNDNDILARTQKFASEVRQAAAPSVQLFIDMLLQEAGSVSLYGGRSDPQRMERAKRAARVCATRCRKGEQ